MTAQIPDRLLLQDQEFSIVGVNGNSLFDPYSVGLQPVSRTTNCWRGYVCEYKLLYNKLLLNKLQINLVGEGQSINNIKPVFSAETRDLFSHTYNGLDLSVEFTGGILAARGFVRELYVHVGFHPAWKYENVLELIVSHGYVIETRDVSRRMEELRKEMAQSPSQPDLNATKKQIEDWIASTFKLDYNF